MLDRLTDTIAAICPIRGVAKSGDSIAIDYSPEANAEQIIAAQLALTTFDWSDTAHTAWTRQKRRDAAIAWVNSDDISAMGIRAALLIVVQEIRALKGGQVTPNQTWNALKTQVAELIADGAGDPEFNPDATP